MTNLLFHLVEFTLQIFKYYQLTLMLILQGIFGLLGNLGPKEIVADSDQNWIF